MSITSVRMSPEVSVPDLTVSQLRALEHFLARQFPVGSKLRTLEIGCGNGTALFSKHSFRHVSVCEDSDLARAAAASVEHAPEFQAQSVRFVFADDKRALDILAEEEPLDIVMIGGPRHPEMLVPAFLALSKRLRRDSILVLRDVHVPTINQLYRILSEDDDLQQVTEIENTVFFWCSGAPSGERIHSGWRRYNDLHRRFQIDATYSTGDVLPLKRTFDGWMRDLPRCFKRGAIISRGMPLIAGRWSVLEFQLVQPYSGDFRVVFDIDVVEATSSNSVKCEINGSDKGTVSLSKGPSQLQYRANFEAVTTVEIKLYCSGSTRPAAYFVRSITIEPVAAQSAPAVGLTWIDGSIATFEAFGTTVSFFVHDPHDTIQAHHAVGQFYEAEELSLLAQHIAPGARVLDIGANIGNHAVWFEKVAHASEVVVIEPQPRMITHLKMNCVLNQLKAVDTSKLGVALGRSNTFGTIEMELSFNPAGAKIVSDPNGQVPIRPGDDVIGTAHFDFVKVDVEGAELDVIEGLTMMINRCHPTLFVEVANANRDAFQKLMKTLGYKAVAEHRRYDESINLLVKPIGRV